MNTIFVFIEKIVRTTQTKKISKNLPEQKSRNPLCIKDFWDFLFDEKLLGNMGNILKVPPSFVEKSPEKSGLMAERKGFVLA